MAGRVGVVGARGQVGQRICASLAARAIAFSRGARPASSGEVEWRVLPNPAVTKTREQMNPGGETISDWIFVAHIWLVPDYFEMLKAFSAKRLIMISSTSRFTKTASSVGSERDLARRLADAEGRVAAWAEANGVAWTVLRPTLIYGGGHDHNISSMAGFVRRFHFFPLLGSAKGLRQPIHVEDVAGACVAALTSEKAANRAYNISGSEVLSYRDMAARVFDAMGKPPRLVPVPLGAIKAALSVVRLVPRFRHWSPGMAERMNLDMVFDHEDAARDFDFRPRPFVLLPRDVAKEA